MAQIAGSDLTAAGLADGGIPVLTVNGGQSTYPFELKNGNNSVAFPVPSLQPGGQGPLNIALDIIPKGSPTDVAGAGVTWIDLCNKDIIANGASPFGCAHLGVFASGDAVLGSTAYNGATAGAVDFQIGAVSKLKVRSDGFVQFTGPQSFSANGSVATSLGSVGPTGANTTVQEWLTFKNAGGTTRYVPAF